MLLAATTAVGQDAAPFDVDLWHQMLYGGHTDPEDREVLLGLYPGASVVLGSPNVLSGQGNLLVSLQAGSSFSLYLGYGEEWGGSANSEIYTVGWGGVRDVPAVRPGRGFYGKFLRYRRWDSSEHDRHEGLSVGTESGVGNLSLTFEFGAARSDRDHWLVVAQVSLKVAIPIGIPIGG
jgi:hypothetical protein